MTRWEPIGQGWVEITRATVNGRTTLQGRSKKTVQLAVHIERADGGFRKATIVYEVSDTGIPEIDGKRFWFQSNHFTPEDAVRGWLGDPPYTHLKSDIQQLIGAIVDTIGRFWGDKVLDYTWRIAWIKTEWMGDQTEGWRYTLDQNTLWIERRPADMGPNGHGVHG